MAKTTNDRRTLWDKKHSDKITLRLPRGAKAAIDTRGQSLNGYLVGLISRDQARGLPGLTWDLTARGVACPLCHKLHSYDLYSKPIDWRYCPACGGQMASQEDKENP